jgi:signal transduction histidine kinase
VADEGPGLSAEATTSVFERFWRGDTSRDRSTGGAGLGLAIVRAIVQRHGGTVSAANRPDGRGAVFSLRLPSID